MTARLLAVIWSLLIAASTTAIELNLPQSRHGRHVTNAVQVRDEALPLGHGILGALVWGDGRPLKNSLDRTDLWDLPPGPEFHSSNCNCATMRQWHEQYRGSAGVLGKAVEQFLARAETNAGERPPQKDPLP